MEKPRSRASAVIDGRSEAKLPAKKPPLRDSSRKMSRPESENPTRIAR